MTMERKKDYGLRSNAPNLNLRLAEFIGILRRYLSYQIHHAWHHITDPTAPSLLPFKNPANQRRRSPVLESKPKNSFHHHCHLRHARAHRNYLQPSVSKAVSTLHHQRHRSEHHLSSPRPSGKRRREPIKLAQSVTGELYKNAKAVTAPKWWHACVMQTYALAVWETGITVRELVLESDAESFSLISLRTFAFTHPRWENMMRYAPPCEVRWRTMLCEKAKSHSKIRQMPHRHLSFIQFRFCAGNKKMKGYTKVYDLWRFPLYDYLGTVYPGVFRLFVSTRLITLTLHDVMFSDHVFLMKNAVGARRE